MESQRNERDKQRTILSAVEETATKAFNPAVDPSSRSEAQQEFSALIARTSTIALLSSLNTLIKPGRVPEWLRVHLMDLLVLLPQRPDGVRAVLEFVFSVHPSSTAAPSDTANPQKQGAPITMEALKMASNLLSAPPVSAPDPETWFPGIAPQLLTLLDGKDGPDLMRASSYVIGFGILGRKKFGAPGTAGWRRFAEPMLSAIDPNVSSTKLETKPVVSSEDEIVDLQSETTITTADDVAAALRRLTALLNSHPNPNLTKRLLGPLLLPFLSLSTWADEDTQIQDQYIHPARNLLEIYLKLAGSLEKFEFILKNLTFNGNLEPIKVVWVYRQEGRGIQVKRLRDGSKPELSWQLVETRTDAFINLLKSFGSDNDIAAIFSRLLKDSLPQKTIEKTDIIIKKEEDDEYPDPTKQLVESKLLQKMMDRMPEKLAAQPKYILDLVGRILAESIATKSADESDLDSASVALSLLNLVYTTPSFQKTDYDPDLIRSIEESVAQLAQAQLPEISQTAHNLALLLRYRDEIDDPDRPVATLSDRQVEERKTYSLALSYITQADSPPPVRAEGLSLLGTLIDNASPVLDVPATLVLLVSLLSDNDEYTHLRSIRLLSRLADRHPTSTTRELLDRYADPRERHTATTLASSSAVDIRLRLGEALLQVIQRLGETLSGELATTILSTLLSVAGRRLRRPKAHAKAQREQRAKDRKREAAARRGEPLDEDEEDDVDMDALDEEDGPEEAARREIIARIVGGWDRASISGEEDLRIRASALSLLGTCMETNFAGLPSGMVEGTVDLALHTLTGGEAAAASAGIVRRAAVLAVLGFVRGCAAARAKGGNHEGGGGILGLSGGSGDVKVRPNRLAAAMPTEESRMDMARVLGYVAETDEDGLVRQHAKDAAESLENWALGEMVGDEGGFAGGSGSRGFSRGLMETLSIGRKELRLPKFGADDEGSRAAVTGGIGGGGGSGGKGPVGRIIEEIE